MNSYLEEEYQSPYNAWKTEPSPSSRAALLQAVTPVLDRGIRTHVGEPNSLLTSRARQLALKSFDTYDPSRARLGAHLTSQLQGLKRIARQQHQVIRAPERVIFDQARLGRYEQELADELGREPTDYELSNRTGFSMARLKKVRGYSQGISEGQLEQVDPGLQPGMWEDRTAHDAWLRIVYDELAPLDQKILEYTLGYNGRPMLSNQEIARKLGRSPGAISQRKQKIQQALDREPNLSPFLE